MRETSDLAVWDLARIPIVVGNPGALQNTAMGYYNGIPARSHTARSDLFRAGGRCGGTSAETGPAADVAAGPPTSSPLSKDDSAVSSAYLRSAVSRMPHVK